MKNIEQLKSLKSLSLSWCSLTPWHLSRITHAMYNMVDLDHECQTSYHQISSFDISYNSLAFDDDFDY